MKSTILKASYDTLLGHEAGILHAVEAIQDELGFHRGRSLVFRQPWTDKLVALRLEI